MSENETLAKLGFKPAGTEWLEALHLSQRDAKQIERTKGIPDNRGKIKFFIAAAEDFTNESRRCLHAHGMGWFRQSSKVAEVNPHLGTLLLTGTFVVYHAPSGQAQIFLAEWTARSDGDALASAHTRLTRRFVQGLLQIAVVDEGAAPEDAPSHAQAQGCSHPQHAIFPVEGTPQWNAQKACWVSEMVCRACGADMGWGPCDAPQQQQTLQAPAPAAPQQMPPQQQPPAPQYQAPAPQPPVAPQSQTYAGQPLLPPVAAEPLVQHAMQVLEATPVSAQEMKQEMAEPAAPGAGAASSPEAWRDGLIAKGLDPENALQIAMLDDGRVVEPELVEQLRGWAFSAYKGESEKINQDWLNVGFEPVTGLPLDQRPRPTGLQVKQFLSNPNMTFKSATAGI
jgi:hypothetical protein